MVSMDIQTIEAYDKTAKKIAMLHNNLVPEALYELINTFFPVQGKILDAGCGTGRDTHWLQKQGFRVIGIDASTGMLQEAMKRYPDCHFLQDTLPDLPRIQNTQFDGILCSAVLMHLSEEDALKALNTLLHLLTVNGVLICSFRHTTEKSCREKGKLYTRLAIDVLLHYLCNQQATLLKRQETIEPERKYRWFNLVIKK